MNTFDFSQTFDRLKIRRDQRLLDRTILRVMSSDYRYEIMWVVSDDIYEILNPPINASNEFEVFRLLIDRELINLHISVVMIRIREGDIISQWFHETARLETERQHQHWNQHWMDAINYMNGPPSVIHIGVDDLTKTLIEFVRANKREDFDFLAQANGAAPDKLDEMWNGLKRR